MKIFTILFSLFLIVGFSFNIYAQKSGKPLIDSLQLELNNYNKKNSDSHKTGFDKRDTIKIRILNLLSHEFTENGEISKAKVYADDAFYISKVIGFKEGLGTYFNLLGNIYGLQGNLKSSLESYFNSLQIRKNLGDKRGIASVINNIGTVYYRQGNYPEAIKNYFDAIKLNEEIGNKKWQVMNYRNIAEIYEFLMNYKDAIKNYLICLKISKEIGDQLSIIIAYSNLGLVYSKQQNFNQALKICDSALQISKKIKDKEFISYSLQSIGLVYEKQGNYSESINYYYSALENSKEIDNKNLITMNYINIGNVFNSLKKYPEALKNYLAALKILKVDNENSENSKCNIKIGSLFTKLHNFSEAKKYLNEALSLSLKSGNKENIKSSYLSLSELDSASNNWKDAFMRRKLFILYNDSLLNVENSKKIVQNQMQSEFDKKELTTKAEQDKKDIVQRNIRNTIVGGLLVALIFLGVVFRQRNKVKDEKAKVVIEKELNEQLLLNILPEEVANELKLTGNSIAKQYNNSTVLFTDFVNFTGISEQLSPIDLVAEIHKNFTAFDAIIEKNGLEKIKTIGDAYLAVCGLPIENNDHAYKVVKAAFEIRDFVNSSNGKFQIRIGINSGPVVAGIVGVKKYAYDIWGDTVNTASRMESNSEAGKINISGNTYELVKSDFNCVYRGKITAKGKGEVDMYFVEC